MVTPFSRPTFAVENIVWLCPAIVRCFHLSELHGGQCADTRGLYASRFPHLRGPAG